MEKGCEIKAMIHFMKPCNMTDLFRDFTKKVTCLNAMLLPPQPAGCVHGTVATFSPLNKYAAHLFNHASGVTGLKEAPYAGTGTFSDSDEFEGYRFYHERMIFLSVFYKTI